MMTLLAAIVGASLIAVGTFLHPGGAGAGAAAVGALSQYGQPPTFPQAPKSTFSVAQAKVFTEFPVYSVGSSFHQYRLAAVLRRKDTANPVPIPPNYVSFIYGDCDAGDHRGCAPPLEIQTSPACLFTPADIQVVPDGEQMVRGVSAYLYEGETELVLVTGLSTVTIYGGNRKEVLAAAQLLQPENLPVVPGISLPAPDTDVFGTCRPEFIIPPPPPPAPPG